MCEALHQLFVENRALVTLVHEQGYDLRLLPLTVQGIPSMRMRSRRHRWLIAVAKVVCGQ